MRRPRLQENRDFYLAVGRRIATLRPGRITQEELAKRAGLTRTSIINIEKGRQQVLLHTLVSIANALRVSPIELIPESSNGLDELLRDKPQKAVDWIRSSTASSKKIGKGV